MKPVLTLLGNAAGVLGVLVCLIAGLARIAGHFYLAGFEAMTLFNGGIALMVAGVLFKVHALASR